jgi:alpha-tubulin suppressor-like RCC1 family protein
MAVQWNCNMPRNYLGSRTAGPADPTAGEWGRRCCCKAAEDEFRNGLRQRDLYMTKQTGREHAAGLRPAASRAMARGAVAAALAISALTFFGGAAMAAASTRATVHEVTAQRASAGRSATPGIAAGGSASGTLRAWGGNANGQLGNGTTTNAGVPVKVELPTGTKVTQVRAGCLHTVALTSKGHVLAWGANGFGELGTGTITDSTTPVRVKISRSTKITAVRAGCHFSLALTSKGHVLAWGDNGFGELGNGTTIGSDTPVRVQLPTGTKATAISAGWNFSLARTSKGHVLAWGLNDNGQLGNGTTTNSDTPVRVHLPTGSKAQILSAGFNFAFASVSGGGVFVWGANNLGQFGDGTTTSSDTPVSIGPMHGGPVGGPIGHLVSLVAGCGHTIALFSRGAVLAWGGNDFGQLGNDTTTSSLTPVRVHLPASAQVKAISASCNDGYALTAKGHVFAWGYNSQGQLGDDGPPAGRDTPARVDLPSGRRAVALGAGPLAEHVLAIVRKKS